MLQRRISEESLADNTLQLEYIFSSSETGRPKFLITCMYGIPFIILGNLSGNGIAFGSYVLKAAGNEEPRKDHVIGLAIGSLTLAILVHVCSRRGGIVMNNIFAVVKVSILVAMIVLGFIKVLVCRSLCNTC